MPLPMLRLRLQLLMQHLKRLIKYFYAYGTQTNTRYGKSNAASTEFSIQSSKTDLEEKPKNINNHWLAIHEKFVIAYSCLLMFFIGAPLGAIIRKGGLGLPIVFAILIFITFHFINTFGRKLAQQDTIPPYLWSLDGINTNDAFCYNFNLSSYKRYWHHD